MKDLIIIGAGAAGLSAARAALASNSSVLILDMYADPLRKVTASGGGRCNFTNSDATAKRYFGGNPAFAISVLSRIKPTGILEWAAINGIRTEEKAPGQFFCANGAKAMTSALLKGAKGASIIQNCEATDIEKNDGGFLVRSKKGDFHGKRVIIASGGISFPSLGVSDIGLKIAKKFGHAIQPPVPGLVALKTDIFPKDLAGASLPVQIRIGKIKIEDPLLFTHFGIGGPACYRASMYDLEQGFHIDFLPGRSALELLLRAKKTEGQKLPLTVLCAHLPAKFARWISWGYDKKLIDCKDSTLAELAERINKFIICSGALSYRGFQSAEVMAGGISTDKISSKTLESKLCPGLYFAGEVLDITGDLGGFNLHFAFASGIVAGGSCVR
jgi:predicted Rossmann fold flavoprotein